jgi:hypothetical protein
MHCILGAEDGCLLPAMADGQDTFFAVPHQVSVLSGLRALPAP